MVILGQFSVYQLAFVTLFLVLGFSGSCSNSASQTNVSNIGVGDKNTQTEPRPARSTSNTAQCGFDENDDSAPTSLISLKNDFKEADIVVFAEVIAIKPDNYVTGYRPHTLTARVRESFKGGFKPDDIIVYGYTFEVYGEEPKESEFLGDRVLWLRRWIDEGKFRYGSIEFMWGSVDCDILEKLRKISKGK